VYIYNINNIIYSIFNGRQFLYIDIIRKISSRENSEPVVCERINVR